MDRSPEPIRHLEAAYDRGTFGISRRGFLKLAAAAGVAAYAGALVFPQDQALASFTEPTEPRWPTFPDDGKIRFTVHSDTHVGAKDVNNYVDKIPCAFQAIYQMAPGIDAHFFVGDSANEGAPEQYDELAELLNANVHAPLGIVMGNHEFYYHEDDEEGSLEEFRTFCSTKLQIAGSFQLPDGPNAGEVDCDFVVGGDGTPGSGYHVLAVSPRLGGYKASWYGKGLDWIRTHVADAAAENPDKPIFLLTHHAFGNTVWNSSEGGSWNGQFGDDPTETNGDDPAFYQELAAQYPQIIHFSGHTHIPMVDPRSIYQDEDGFTMIQTATFANNFWMGEIGEGLDEEGSTKAHPAAGQDASQCELVEIDPATHAVSIYRLDFREGAVLGDPWLVIPSEGRAGFRYTYAAMEETSLPPVVDPDATVTCDGTSFTLTADKVRPDEAGLADDVVISYRIEVLPAAGEKDGQGEKGTAVYDALFMSDYYKATVNRAAAFTRPLFGAELEAGADYVLRAWARNTFDKESLVGEAAFRA